MNDPQSTRFRFSPDDEPQPESLLAEPAADLQLDKVRRRINRIYILLPLLIIIALAGVYWVLHQQLKRSQDTGSIEVLQLSKDLEASFSALSVKQAKLDELLNKQLAPLNERLTIYEQNGKELKGRLQNLEKSLAAMAKSKLGPQDLEKSAASLTAKINVLAQEVKRLTKTVEGNGSTVAQQFKEMGATVDQSVLELGEMAVALDGTRKIINQLQNQMAKLKAAQISPERLEAALADLRLNLQDNDHITLLISEQEVLDKRLNTLAQQIKAVQAQMGRVSPPVTSPPSPVVPAPAPVTTSPGGIQEQDIN